MAVLTSFTKSYLEWVKIRRNDSKFTIVKYRINTIKIIRLFPINIFMPAANFPCLTILLFYRTKPFMIFGQFGVFFPKKPTTENWSFLKIHFPAVKVPLSVCVYVGVCLCLVRMHGCVCSCPSAAKASAVWKDEKNIHQWTGQRWPFKDITYFASAKFSHHCFWIFISPNKGKFRLNSKPKSKWLVMPETVQW